MSPSLSQLVLAGRPIQDHWTNILHHANTKAFTNALFPALGWSIGLMPLALVLGLMH